MKPPSALREEEIVLVICSPRAQQIANAMARMKSVGHYRLASVPPQFIRDVYFDTPTGALRSRRISLRLRIVNEKRLLTFKEALAHETRRVHARVEIEQRWSRATWARMMRELQARGIAIENRMYLPNDPLRTLASAGLQIIQQRVTRRRVRRVLQNRRVCAELVIDTTTFFFGKQAVHLREVEIEAQGVPTCLDDLAQRLQAMFAPALQPWYGKLVTGRTIEALLQRGELQHLLDEQHNLTPAALARIKREWEQMNGGTNVL
ncbi:MAG: CYTH domain-containing protein [Anaerolineae bacterium]|nr:CYTH domain-containing protein [Anaerolineae bacterium]